MLPDPNYHEKLQAKEYEQLEKLNAQLTQHEIQEHIDNETKLLANQNKVEGKWCIYK
jgi:Zn-dependent M16 (insulinase) family peptidase